MRTFKPLKAAPPGTRPQESYAPNSSRQESSPGRSKRDTIKVACVGCRKRKSKCDGERPSCAACRKKNIPCEYEEPTVHQKLRHQKDKVQTLSERLQSYERLVNLFMSCSNEEAITLLHVLRTFGDVERTLEWHAETKSTDGQLLLDGDSMSRDQTDGNLDGLSSNLGDLDSATFGDLQQELASWNPALQMQDSWMPSNPNFTEHLYQNQGDLAPGEVETYDLMVSEHGGKRWQDAPIRRSSTFDTMVSHGQGLME